MINDFCKQLSLLVINAISSSELKYTKKKMMKEIKSEMITFHSLSFISIGHLFRSKYFKIEPGQESFTLTPLHGGRGLEINKTSKPYIDYWLKQAPKPLTVEEWKVSYGK